MNSSVKGMTVSVRLFAAAAGFICGACIPVCAGTENAKLENPEENVTVAQVEGGIVQINRAGLDSANKAFSALVKTGTSPNMAVKHPSGLRELSYPRTLAEAFTSIGWDLVRQMGNEGSRGIDVVTIKNSADKSTPLSMNCFYDRGDDDQAQSPLVIACSLALPRTPAYQAKGLSQTASP